MKLKDNVKIKKGLDYITIVSGGYNKIGKITGSTFPALIGKNNFKSVGAEILNRLGCVEYEAIDPFYTLRGAIAEHLVYHYIKDQYKKVGIDVELHTFPNTYKGSDGKYYGNDIFKKNAKCGGVIDIGIAKPENQRAVIEIKSKSLFSEKTGQNNHFEMFKPNQEPKQYENETLQGEHYAALMGLKKLLMVYVFFNDTQEKMVREITKAPYYDLNRVIIEKLVDTLGFHYKDFKIEVVRMEVDIPKIKTLQEQAYEKLRKAFNSRQIPIEWFSRQDLIDMKPNYV